MADPTLITSFLNCDEECKKTIREDLKRKIWVLIPSLLLLILLIPLCITVTMLQEKRQTDVLDCVLRTTWEKLETCYYTDQYPLSNEVYLRICVNETVRIDIRRFNDGNPTTDGIDLSLMQWQYLKKSVDHVDNSILQSKKHA
jgi:hypothetical protein